MDSGTSCPGVGDPQRTARPVNIGPARIGDSWPGQQLAVVLEQRSVAWRTASPPSMNAAAAEAAVTTVPPLHPPPPPPLVYGSRGKETEAASGRKAEVTCKVAEAGRNGAA